MQKKLLNGEKTYRLLFKYYSSTFGAIIFSCAVQGYLSSTLKQKLYQESDFQQNVEAFKNWQSLTAILPSQQTPHAKDSVYSTPTASSRI